MASTHWRVRLFLPHVEAGLLHLLSRPASRKFPGSRQRFAGHRTRRSPGGVGALDSRTPWSMPRY